VTLVIQRLATDARPVPPADLLLVAHGSRRGEGCDEMSALGAAVAALAPERVVRLGYLELSDPPALEVLEGLVAAGSERVVVVPLMLYAAGHSKSDVPAVVLEARARHPRIDLHYARPLGVDHALVGLARQRVEAAGALGLPLAVLSRGTSDPDANADAYKVSRLLAELTGTRRFATGFSGLTWPSVPEALEELHSCGATRVATFAWFLATGVLVERMRQQCAELGHARGIEIVDAGHLGVDEAVARLVLERAAEAEAGQARANCDVCVHRRAWPGLEDRVGAERGLGHSHLASEHLRGEHHAGENHAGEHHAGEHHAGENHHSHPVETGECDAIER
jgi:sirohydrochlorin cobaltochelatase